MRVKQIPTITCLSGLLLLALLWLIGPQAMAAQLVDETWETPQNISQSGSASAPFLAIDSNGTGHIFWQDAIDGFMYTTRTGDGLADPTPVRLPFSQPIFSFPGAQNFTAMYTPHLVADATFLYAVWLDSEQTLFFSRGAIANLPDPNAWSTAVMLDTSAAAPKLVTDNSGNLHLAYVKQRGTVEQPAGIYYQRFTSQANAWSSPQLRYASNYLRAIPAEQAHVALSSSADGSQLYLAWDNPLLNSVFFTRSTNSGDSWEEPTIIDQKRPDDAPDSNGAARIETFSRGQEVHLTWQAEHGPSGCQQYHQWSVNGGQTWRDAIIVFSDALQCPELGQLFTSADGNLLFLQSKLRGEYALNIWVDQQWSQTVAQPTMISFLNDQTLQPVRLGCQQTAVTPTNHWLVLGCNLAAPQDIWLLQRPLGQAEDWQPFFANNTAWAQPEAFANSGATFLAPQLLADDHNVFHALWIGSNDTFSAREANIEIGENTLYYAHWSNGTWSRRALLRELPGSNQLTAQLYAGEILAVWRNTASNTLYLSQAQIERAAFPGDWSTPTAIAMSPLGISSPALHLDAQNEILYLAYAIPINEGRGIYLIQSADGGLTWSEPVQVFDGVAANWAKVDSAQLAQTADGVLHLIWLRYNLVENSQPTGVFYAQSTDAGRTWSTHQAISEQEVNWAQITILENRVFRIWREVTAEQTAVWFDTSTNSGLTWETPSPIPGNAPITGELQITPGQDTLYLLELKHESAQANQSTAPTLTKWSWRGSSWSLDESLALPQSAWTGGPRPFQTAHNQEGQLMVIYPRSESRATQPPDIQLLSLQRTPPPSTLPQPETTAATDGLEMEPTPVDQATSGSPDTLATAPTPGVEENLLPPPGLPEEIAPPTSEEMGSLQIGPIDASTQIGGLLIGAIPAALMVLLVFAFSLRAAYRKQR